jgi:hypothetical protein
LTGAPDAPTFHDHTAFPGASTQYSVSVSASHTGLSPSSLRHVTTSVAHSFVGPDGASSNPKIREK